MSIPNPAARPRSRASFEDGNYLHTSSAEAGVDAYHGSGAESLGMTSAAGVPGSSVPASTVNALPKRRRRNSLGDPLALRTAPPGGSLKTVPSPGFPATRRQCRGGVEVG